MNFAYRSRFVCYTCWLAAWKFVAPPTSVQLWPENKWAGVGLVTRNPYKWKQIRELLKQDLSIVCLHAFPPNQHRYIILIVKRFHNGTTAAGVSVNQFWTHIQMGKNVMDWRVLWLAGLPPSRWGLGIWQNQLISTDRDIETSSCFEGWSLWISPFAETCPTEALPPGSRNISTWHWKAKHGIIMIT